MAGRLWNYFDGEPFLDNPHLAIVSNSPKGRKPMANRMPAALKRYWAKHRRNKPKRRRAARRNAFPVSGAVAAMNRPKKRSRASARHNPPMRRRYRRNPALLGVELPPLQSVVYAGAGFIIPPILESYVMPYLPLSLQTSTVGRYVARIGSVLGLTYLAKALVGTQEAKMVAIGGGAYVLTTAIRDFAPDLLPSVAQPATTTATTVRGYQRAVGGLGRGMGSYTRALGAPAFGAVRPVGAASAPMGGANLVASRFRRLQ